MFRMNLKKMKQNEQTKNSVKQIFTEYLKTHSLRKTPERFAILDMIYSIEGHFDIEQLYEKLNEAKYPISRATLYNNISLLIDAKLLIRHHINNNVAQYEKSYNTGMHNHMICSVCGKVKEFSDQNILRAIKTKKMTNFTPSHYTLYIYGICNKCAHKQEEESRKKDIKKS